MPITMPRNESVHVKLKFWSYPLQYLCAGSVRSGIIFWKALLQKGPLSVNPKYDEGNACSVQLVWWYELNVAFASVPLCTVVVRNFENRFRKTAWRDDSSCDIGAEIWITIQWTCPAFHKNGYTILCIHEVFGSYVMQQQHNKDARGFERCLRVFELAFCYI